MGPRWPSTSRVCSKAKSPTRASRSARANRAEVSAPPAPEKEQKNSQSRFRFRPPLRPTFGFRLLPPGGASTYLRSVLRASRTLSKTPLAGQVVGGRIVRNLRVLSAATPSRKLWKGEPEGETSFPL